MNKNRIWLASSESKEKCTYPKGVYFDYCVLYKTDEGFELEGKGRYGCNTIVPLNEKQVETWLNLPEDLDRN